MRCDKRPHELYGPLQAEDRPRLGHALQMLEDHGTPFVVRNLTRLSQDMRRHPPSDWCETMPNDMARQMQVVQEDLARFGRWKRTLLNAYLALRCWWVGGSACSIETLFSAFPATLEEYSRTVVSPFGTFGGDRLLQWALGDVGLAVLFDWTFMASAHHSGRTSKGPIGDECGSPARMLGIHSTVDALSFGADREEELAGNSGEVQPTMLGTTDVFVSSQSSHHNLLHRHHSWCDGMVSAAWQVEGTKAWWVYDPDVTDELGSPRAHTSCCDTWTQSPAFPQPLSKPRPALSRCWGAELESGDLLVFRSNTVHFAFPLSPMVSAITHFTACGARRGERLEAWWPAQTLSPQRRLFLREKGMQLTR